MATFDGFISYSHSADGRLAPALQAGLQRFAKPWWRRRALRVFRDQSGLSANPHLWASIETALADSEWFVLLCSPEAAASPWVGREIEWWLANRDRARVLPVVTSGTFVWDQVGDRLDVNASTAVPPALAPALVAEPRWIDLRWVDEAAALDLRNPSFRDAVADVAAPLRGVAKDELESEEVHQHRRTMRTAKLAAGALVLLAIVAVAAGITAARQRDEATAQRNEAETQRNEAETQRAEAESQRNEAEAQRSEAESQRAEAESQRVVAEARLLSTTSRDRRDSDVSAALVMAVEAVGRVDDVGTRGALWDAVAASVGVIEVDHSMAQAGMDWARPVDESTWLAIDDQLASSPLVLWDLEADVPSAVVLDEQPFDGPSISRVHVADGGSRAAVSVGGSVWVYDLATGSELVNFDAGEPDASVFAWLTPDGAMVLTLEPRVASMAVWDAATGEQVASRSFRSGTRDGYDFTSIAVSSSRVVVSSQHDLNTTLPEFVDVVDPATLEQVLPPIRREPNSLGCSDAALLSPAGSVVALPGVEPGVVEFVELETGAVVASADVADCDNAAVWLDDARLAVATEDGVVRVVDARDGSAVVVATGVGAVSDLWWPSGVGVGEPGTLTARGFISAQLYSIAVGGSSPAQRLMGPRGEALVALAGSPDGDRFVTQSAGLGAAVAGADLPPVLFGPVPASMASTAQIWDVATGAVVGEVELPDGQFVVWWDAIGVHTVSGVGFSASGHDYAMTDPDTGEVVWSASDAASAQFSPDGSVVAVLTADYSAVRVMSVPGGDTIGEYPLPRNAYNAIPQWSPDGLMLYTTLVPDGAPTSVLTFEPERSDVWTTLTTLDSFVYTGGLDGDGARLALASADELSIIDTGSGEILSRIEIGAGARLTAAWSPDGSMIVVGDYDGTIQLVDVDAGVVVGSPLQLDASPVFVGFVDDEHLGIWHTASSEMSIVPVGVRAWVETACAIAGRNLTVAEWEFHLPGRPYESTCPQWPPGQ